MSIAPKGMSVLEGYRLYREDILFVNRKYQRKLVWTLEEKQGLIDSLIKAYPIPLFLFAETQRKPTPIYEVMDGVQRLNAIFSFIENSFSVDGKYFDVNELPRARQAAEAHLFEPVDRAGNEFWPPDTVANILDYQLAVTIFPIAGDDEVVDIFGRINSGGKQLSSQEKRQAGMVDSFSALVRTLASEIRGDTSRDILPLAEMPEISIDSMRRDMGYSLKAEDVFWCFQGILRISDLRDSEDEEFISDVCASIIFGQPIARSKELLDSLYDPVSPDHEELIRQFNRYGLERLHFEVLTTLSVIKSVIEDFSPEPKVLRNVINPGSTNPIKEAFFSLFMAFHDLIIVEEKSPDSPKSILDSISGLQQALEKSAHYANVEDRVKNIGKTKGLIQNHFVKKDPPMYKHGAGLAIDFENSLRRSRIETARYEFKQGFLDLAGTRKLNEGLDKQILETICAIANVGPDSHGFVFVGVADKSQDAERIKELDKIEFQSIGERYVVGIDRELPLFGITQEQYLNRVLNFIRKSQLSDPLKDQVLGQIDTIEYKGLSVIRMRIPPQSKISFLGDKAYVRQNSSTIEANAKQIAAIAELFQSKQAL